MQTDPGQRLALVTAYEALEMSGWVPNRTPSTQLERIGTFYGQTSDEYKEQNMGQEVGTYYIPGGIRAFGPVSKIFFFENSIPSRTTLNAHVLDARVGLTTTSSLVAQRTMLIQLARRV